MSLGFGFTLRLVPYEEQGLHQRSSEFVSMFKKKKKSNDSLNQDQQIFLQQMFSTKGQRINIRGFASRSASVTSTQFSHHSKKQPRTIRQ